MNFTVHVLRINKACSSLIRIWRLSIPIEYDGLPSAGYLFADIFLLKSDRRKTLRCVYHKASKCQMELWIFTSKSRYIYIFYRNFWEVFFTCSAHLLAHATAQACQYRFDSARCGGYSRSLSLYDNKAMLNIANVLKYILENTYMSYRFQMYS